MVVASCLSSALPQDPSPTAVSKMTDSCPAPHHQRRILEACAVKMFRSSLGPNDSDAQLCMKTYDHTSHAKQLAFIKKFGI